MLAHPFANPHWTRSGLRLLIVCFAVVVLAAVTACDGDDDCDSPTSPCGGSALTGVWSGSSNYINAPFTIDLRQSGTSLSGQYSDQKDAGSVSGTVSGSSITMDVNFGDTGMRMTGTVQSTTRITGEIVVPVLGNRTFSFEMTR